VLKDKQDAELSAKKKVKEERKKKLLQRQLSELQERQLSISKRGQHSSLNQNFNASDSDIPLNIARS